MKLFLLYPTHSSGNVYVGKIAIWAKTSREWFLDLGTLFWIVPCNVPKQPLSQYSYTPWIWWHLEHLYEIQWLIEDGAINLWPNTMPREKIKLLDIGTRWTGVDRAPLAICLFFYGFMEYCRMFIRKIKHLCIWLQAWGWQPHQVKSITRPNMWILQLLKCSK